MSAKVINMDEYRNRERLTQGQVDELNEGVGLTDDDLDQLVEDANDDEAEDVECPNCAGEGSYTNEDDEEIECAECSGTGETSPSDAAFMRDRGVRR